MDEAAIGDTMQRIVTLRRQCASDTARAEALLERVRALEREPCADNAAWMARVDGARDDARFVRARIEQTSREIATLTQLLVED